MASPRHVFLSLGSNVGDRETNLSAAERLLEAEGVKIVKKSSLYETEPQERSDQSWFLNLVLRGETVRQPLDLLLIFMKIEKTLGRVRELDALPKGPRIIDIDILLYGNTVIDSPALQIPHPRMTQRRFVLEPLYEIAPDLRDPRSGRFFREFLPATQSQELKRIS